MAEYIEREAFLERVDGIWDCADMVFEPNDKCCRSDDCASCKWRETKNAIRKIAAKIPAADVRPVVKAKWEENKRGSYCVVCSNCGFGFPTGFVWYDCNRASDEREFSIMTEDADLNFCPNCGADMREES